MRPWAIALLLLPALLPGCTQGDPGSAEPEWTEVVVPARQMLDLEYFLSSGTDVTWRWESSSSVAFQVLYVEGSSTYPFASEYGIAGEGERTTPREGRYDMTWDNRGSSDILVRFIVPDGYRQTVWPPGQGPGCAPLLLGQVC